MPTRPLLCGTCLSSQSIVSQVSVLSSMAFWSRLSRGAEHDELPLGAEPPADVLEDEDEALFGELRAGHLEAPGGAAYPVRGAVQEEGEVGGGTAGREDPGMQPDTVPHRDHHVGRVERRNGQIGRAHV